jgi:hypothetical protein
MRSVLEVGHFSNFRSFFWSVFIAILGADMQIDIHNRQTTLIALAIGGLIALGKDLAAGVASLYVYAQTPKGLAAVAVACMLFSAATFVATVLKK